MPSTSDSDGRAILKGSVVILQSLPPYLTKGLPEEDVRAIEAQVGRLFEVVDVIAAGLAELEFTSDDGVLHTIFVEGVHLELVEARRG